MLGGRPGDKGFGDIMKHEENPFDRDPRSVPLYDLCFTLAPYPAKY